MTDPTTQVEQRFDHLIASAPQKRRAWSSNTAIVSLVIHSVLIAGAAYATVRAPDQQRSERPITFIELEPERVVEEARPEENARQAGPSPEARTETVTPPEETPLVIPEIDFTEPAISANTFSGEGTIDVIAEGVAGEGDAKPAEVFAYTVAELNEIPRLRNQLQMTSVFERLYPRILQDAGIGGTVWLEFVIEADGVVDMESVKVLDSPHDQLAGATVDAVERFRFNPGRYQGEPVRVLIQMPITWRPAH